MFAYVTNIHIRNLKIIIKPPAVIVIVIVFVIVKVLVKVKVIVIVIVNFLINSYFLFLISSLFIKKIYLCGVKRNTMRQKLYLILYWAAALMCSCTGGDSSLSGRGHVPQASDTLFTERAAMDVYGTQPERAL